MYMNKTFEELHDQNVPKIHFSNIVNGKWGMCQLKRQQPVQRADNSRMPSMGLQRNEKIPHLEIVLSP